MDSGQLGSLLPLVLIVAVFWFLVLRPARKRQREAKQLQTELAPGEQVMLTSGIYGWVTELDDETLDLEISPGVVITAHKQAVARVIDTSGYVDDEGSDVAGEHDSDPETDGDTRYDSAHESAHDSALDSAHDAGTEPGHDGRTGGRDTSA